MLVLVYFLAAAVLGLPFFSLRFIAILASISWAALLAAAQRWLPHAMRKVAGGKVPSMELGSVSLGVFGGLTVTNIAVHGLTSRPALRLAVSSATLSISPFGGWKGLVALRATGIRVKHVMKAGAPAPQPPAGAKQHRTAAAATLPFAQLPTVLSLLNLARIQIEDTELSVYRSEAEVLCKIALSRVELKTDASNAVTLVVSGLQVTGAAGCQPDMGVERVSVNVQVQPTTGDGAHSTDSGGSAVERLRSGMLCLPQVHLRATVQNIGLHHGDGTEPEIAHGFEAQISVLPSATGAAFEGKVGLRAAPSRKGGAEVELALHCAMPIDGPAQPVLDFRVTSSSEGEARQVLEVSSLAVARTADQLEVRADKCQLAVLDADVLQLVRFARPAQHFRSILSHRAESTSRSPPPDVPVARSPVSARPTRSAPIQVTVATVCMQLNFGGRLLEIEGAAVDVSSAPDTTTVRLSRIRTHFCSVQMLAVESVSLSMERPSRQQDSDRAAQVLLAVKIDAMIFSLPHGLKFGDALKEFLTTVKALKLAHLRGQAAKRAVEEDGGPARKIELEINVELTDGTFEIHDDPMDLWLNVQYRLLLLEIQEQHLCSEKLGERLAVQRCQRCENGEKCSRCVEEAIAEADLLASKSAQRYQRTVEAMDRKQEPLFCIRIAAGRVKLPKEEWASTYDNIVSKMQSCDSATFPASATAPFAFTGLIPITLRAELTDISMQIRDYCLPLLTVQNLAVTGPLILAEQSVAPEFWSRRDVHIGGEFVSSLVKTAAPMKIFHELQADIDGLCLCIGTAFLPALADVSVAFSRLSAGAAQPSAKPLSSWDKVRFLMHGTLTASINNFSLAFLASMNPHVKGEHATLSAARANLDCVSQNQWNVSLVEANASFTSSTAPKLDAVHLPSVQAGAKMHWESLSSSHFVHAFAGSAIEAFPNRNLEESLAELGQPKTCPSDVYSAFRSHSWSLKLHLACKSCSADRSDQVVELWTTSFPWLQTLSHNFTSSPFSKAAIIKMSRTKIGVDRKRRQPSLGALLQSLECRVEVGPLKILLWNPDQNCMQVQASGTDISLDLHNSTTADESESGVSKAIFLNLTAHEFGLEWFGTDGPDPLRLCSCRKLSLVKNATTDAAGDMQNRNEVDVRIADVLVWCSLENRNFLSDWIASVMTNTSPRAEPKTDSSGSVPQTSKDVAGDMLEFLATALETDHGEESLGSEPTAESPKIGERIGLVVAIQFSRPQIRIKSQDGGCIVLTATEALIEQARHLDLQSTSHTNAEMQVVTASLQHTKLFIASEVHFHSDVGVSVEAVEDSSTNYHEGSGAQQIMAPCELNLAVHKWSNPNFDALRGKAAESDTIELKMPKVNVAMNSRQFGTLKEAIGMLTSRFPHLERVAEDKKKAMCHQQPGHGSEAFVLSVSAKLGLRRTMEAIEADIAEMERSSPGNKQGLESLRARQKECVETVLEQAKQVEQEWQDIERRLQIKVAIEDVSWTLLDDCKAIASVELSGIRLQKALFSNTSSVLHVSVDDVQVTRPGQTAEVLRKMAQPAATAYGTAPLLRVLAKQAAPVGGVNVYELLEIHLQPVCVAMAQELLEQAKQYMFSPDESEVRRSSLWQPAAGGVQGSLAGQLGAGTPTDQTHRRSHSTEATTHGDLSIGSLLSQEQSTPNRAGAVRPKRTPGHSRRHSSESDPTTMFAEADAEWSRPQQRSAFGCIRVGEVRLEVSYTGTKRFLPNFECLPLRMKELNYKSKVWTMEQLADRVIWDVAKQVGPQAVGKWASGQARRQVDTSPSAVVPSGQPAAPPAIAAMIGTPIGTPPPDDRSREDRAKVMAFSAQRGRAMLFGNGT